MIMKNAKNLKDIQIKDCLTAEEQQNILYGIVTGCNFSVQDFYKVLKYDFKLTPEVVYLSHIREG